MSSAWGDKRALSTLGLPGMPLAEALEFARTHGCTGLELRCAPGEPVNLDMTTAERRAAAAALDGSGLTLLCLVSYVRLGAPDPAALRANLGLAVDLGMGALRVFPGGATPAGLATCVREAEPYGVRVLAETHDSHPSGRAIADLLAAAPGAGAIWDVLHTHNAGETFAQTEEILAPYLAYVQVKDVTADGVPTALGAGVLPLADLAYDGWRSWEYEAPWYPEAVPLPELM